MTDWTAEREDVLNRFREELAKATGDGSKKRQSGTKPPWYRDPSHEGAIFSHLTRWKRGEMVDPDSGAHPLVHAAWRCLAIACQETGNTPDGDPYKNVPRRLWINEVLDTGYVPFGNQGARAFWEQHRETED